MHVRFFLFILLLSCSFNVSAAEVKLDKFYYFVDSNSSSNLNVKVGNLSNSMTGVEMFVYALGKDNKFDTKNEFKDVDIYPKRFFLAANENSNVNLVWKPENNERIMRLRAIPQDIRGLLKDNPLMIKLLDEEDKAKYTMDSGVVKSQIDVGIGMGAIVVLQPFSKVNPGLLKVSLEGDSVILTNTTNNTISAENILINNKISAANVILTPNSNKVLSIDENVSEIKYLSFSDQFNKKHTIR